MEIGGVVVIHARGWFEGVGQSSVSTAEGSNRYSVSSGLRPDVL